MGLGGPGRPGDLPKRRGAHFWKISRAPGAAQAPEIDELRPVKKSSLGFGGSATLGTMRPVARAVSAELLNVFRGRFLRGVLFGMHPKLAPRGWGLCPRPIGACFGCILNKTPLKNIPQTGPERQRPKDNGTIPGLSQD